MPDRSRHIRREQDESDLEWELRLKLWTDGVPAPERQVVFHPRRRWRFDLAWPQARLAIEIQGGTYSGGRHVRGAGYAADCAKLNAAVLAGWRVLWVTRDMVDSGEAVDVARRALCELPPPLETKQQTDARYGSER